MSRADISAVNRMFEDAARKGDVDRLASLYTKDAMAFPPDGPIVRGREDIKQMWATVAQQMGLKDVKLETLDLEVAGDTACEVGQATLTLSGAGMPPTAVVKFVVVWKQEGGQWRLHRDIWNNKAA
jgi:uncharacterized protein (TIGR02246 family)